MRAAVLKPSLRARLRHPGWWSAAAALPMVPAVLVLLGPGPQRLKALLEFSYLALVWVPGVFLCPIPWQWTGDDRPFAGWGRGLLQCLVLGVGLGALVLPLGLLLGRYGDSRGSAFLLGMAVGISLPFLLFLVPAGWVLARAERLAQEAREAQARAREAAWMGQRGAFSPKLLFSNLNHLADRAAADARGTEQGLVDLAALYRRWLVEAELPLVPLATERSLADQYLELERRRWGGRLKVRWHLDPDQDAFLVPPLLLLPLLEWAVAGEPANDLELELREESLPAGLALRLRARAGRPPESALLLQVQRRLAAGLGTEASASLVPLKEGWEVRLRLPRLTESRQDGEP